TSDELAQATATSERYVREWLAQQAAVGFVTYDPDRNTFELPPEHAAVLASDDSPVAMIGAALMISGLHRRTEELARAFHSGAGIPWSDQDAATFESIERFFQVSYRNSLANDWIPSLDGVHEKLLAGGTVADVGCGHGAALIILATAYPAARCVGYDVHERAIEIAGDRAAAAGVSDRVRFEVKDCQEYATEGYDLITFFDAFHDLGDRVG